MKLRRDNTLYRRNLKQAFIISLTLMIVVFYFFPRIEKKPRNIQQNEFAISFLDVPATRQESSAVTAPPQPALPNIFLPADDIETALIDVDIPSESGEMGDGSSSAGSSGKGNSAISAGYSAPRQILEVFPEKTKSKHTGQIMLSLRIGADGKVISHRIVQNTTGSEECLANSIKAAYKSKWSPINISGEYWVEKKYEFK